MPVSGETLGLWKAGSETELKGIIATLPLHKWMTVEITPLNPHPNDPAGKKA
jgi:muconolactone D-isomerase